MDQIEWVNTHPVSGRVHPDAKTGYAVAMGVDTGNIVAMASMPDYDTNVWKNGSISSTNGPKLIRTTRMGRLSPIHQDARDTILNRQCC